MLLEQHIYFAAEIKNGHAEADDTSNETVDNNQTCKQCTLLVQTSLRQSDIYHKRCKEKTKMKNAK